MTRLKICDRTCRGQLSSALFFEAEGELFDDRVGENLAGDAFDLGLGGDGIKAVGEGEEEVFALANVVDAAVIHPSQRICDRLTLCIQDCSFEGYIDMGLHHV